MSVEVIEQDGTTYAEIIRADLQGREDAVLLAAGVVLPVRSPRARGGLQGARPLPQVLRAPDRATCSRCSSFSAASSTSSCTRRRPAVSRDRLGAGDAIVLIRGVHAIHVIEDFQALSVKRPLLRRRGGQGRGRRRDGGVIPVYEPFIGDEEAEAVAAAVGRGEISGSFGENRPPSSRSSRTSSARATASRRRAARLRSTWP